MVVPRGPEPIPPRDPRRPLFPFVPRVPPPPPVEPAPSYSESTTALVQRKLKKLGYYQGTVDGELGRGTRSAIRDFQDENSLEVTGQIDRALIRALGL